MKRVSFGPKPPAVPGQSADQWVTDQPPTEPTKRLTTDIPLGLHKRVKAGCAVEQLVMADVIREMLDQRFPEQANAKEQFPKPSRST